jgi:homoserine O-acetyltransferase
VIDSPYGHDAFLIETEQIAALVKELFTGSESRAGCR